MLFLREDVLQVHLHAAVHLGINATGRRIVHTAYAAHCVLERVDTVGLGVYTVKFA